jgi:acyl-CoA thioester hydrolase
LSCDAASYCVSIAVLERDIDHMGHVNNAVYVQWVQMATQSFWESRASPQMLEETLWIALRHEVDYRRPTLLGDRIHVTLRLISLSSARAVLEYLIHRENQQVARLVSTWCCIDAVSRRPKRISDTIYDTFVGSRSFGGRRASSV